MFGGLNPAKMQSMMKKLGIQQEEIDAEKVIIKGKEKDIIIENPSVTKIIMQGQETFQIIGDAREVFSEDSGDESIKEDDIKAVIEKTGKSRQEAEQALKDADGDLAEAILSLN